MLQKLREVSMYLFQISIYLLFFLILFFNVTTKMLITTIQEQIALNINIQNPIYH